jgi:hypothetical protein
MREADVINIRPRRVLLITHILQLQTDFVGPTTDALVPQLWLQNSSLLSHSYAILGEP